MTEEGSTQRIDRLRELVEQHQVCYEVWPEMLAVKDKTLKVGFLLDNALRETPKRRFRLEVVLGIRILHRHGFDQPVDECEEVCLKEMRQKLKELGVHESDWQSERQRMNGARG
jgi:hypothetical protein